MSAVYIQDQPDTKDEEFLFDVELVNEKFVLHTDTLHYNTDTHIADIVGYTTILSDSATIYSDNGWYDTDKDEATLYDRSLIVTKEGQTLTGDTLFYDNKNSFVEAYGTMVLIDSVNSSILEGNYGVHDYIYTISFANKRSRAIEYSPQNYLFLRRYQI